MIIAIHIFFSQLATDFEPDKRFVHKRPSVPAGHPVNIREARGQSRNPDTFERFGHSLSPFVYPRGIWVITGGEPMIRVGLVFQVQTVCNFH